MGDIVLHFFLLGLLAGLVRSDLKVPPQVFDMLSILLMLAIGLKGGVGLTEHALAGLLLPLAVVVAFGVAQTGLVYLALRLRLERADAASFAAHLGSVSLTTFAVAVDWLGSRGVPFESYLPAFLAVMEVPPIVTGILIVHGRSALPRWRRVAREAFFGKSVTLLVGGMAIGWLAGAEGIAPVTPLFFDLFKAMLAIFLLEMGILVAKQSREVLAHGWLLLVIGLLFPPLSALAALPVAVFLGLSVGGATLFLTLAASASYIAVPAAMRLSIPEAKPGLTLPAVLCVVFPFNVVAGIPLYHRIASAWLEGI